MVWHGCGMGVAWVWHGCGMGVAPYGCTRFIIFFPVPRAGLFSVKIQTKLLAIKHFSVNETMSGQPNKCLIH